MKFLVFGATGQVGFELLRSLVPLGEVIAATRDGLLPGGEPCQRGDLSDRVGLETLLQAVRPDFVINAAAYTAVDRAESEPERAASINTLAPATLAHWCAVHGARLVQYSTDYVFDGASDRPWRERDPTAPLGVYGRSKRDGEVAIGASGCEHLILRSGWIHAARGQNFLRTMLRLAGERRELGVVDDQFGAPTPARWIAAATAAILVRALSNGPWQSGIVHLSAAGRTSWHGFAQEIFRLAQAAGVLQEAPRLVPIPSSAYPTAARRPAQSCLDNRLLRERYGIVLPDWSVGVAQVVAELASCRAGSE